MSLDKAELKNICSRWLWKAFETGTKQDPFSADNSEYWHPSIDLKWSKEMAEELQEYANKVNREREKIAFIAGMGYVKLGLKSKNYKEDAFDEWKSNQEE